MYVAVTRQEGGGSRLLNFVVMGEDFFIHRQVERRDGRTFMRAKKRLV